MKLNASQKSVVDRLRDDWLLHIHGHFRPSHRSKIEAGPGMQFVHHSTRVSLREKGIIVHDFRSGHYYLTEAYKAA